MKLKQIIHFLQVDIWQVSSSKVSPVRWIIYEIIKIVVLAVRFFTTKRVMNQASALTYSTLLAIVPILAVVFAIARGFGFNKYIEIWFRDAFKSQPQASDAIVGFVNSYLVHIQSGLFLGVGLLFMLYTVLMLLSNVEHTFNEIWMVKKPRSIFRTCTDYLAMFFMFPLVIVLTSGISIFMATISHQIPDIMLLSTMKRIMLDIFPYVLMSLLFIALYVFMPNTHVEIRKAIIPGVLAGIAMQWLQIFYIHSQIWVSSYNAIYGSFAALPLFMLWVQISWTICLFGAELCYTSQNLVYYDYDVATSGIAHRYRIYLCALLMSIVCKRFAAGKKAFTALELSKQSNVPIRVVVDLVYKLIDARMLVEITSDEKGASSSFMPAEAIDNLSLGIMIDRLESQGTWKLDISINQVYSSNWNKAILLRSDYLKQTREIMLKDL